MQREFEAFAQAPTRSSFLAAFQALLSRSRRPLAAEDFAQLLALLDAGDQAGFSQALANLPPLSALSPAVHRIAADAAQAADDQRDCQLEQYLLATCLAAILQTGDGSAASPYVVTCTMDERHVCEVLGLAPRSQALLNFRGKALDVIECAGGTNVCFDVSALVPLPAPQPPRRKKDPHSAGARRQSARCVQAREKRLSQT